MKIDLLYLCWNRLQFTTSTWAWLLSHTDLDLVDRIVVYDDGSEDGTLEFLRDQTAKGKIRHHGRNVPVELRISDLRSPPAIMNHYLATTEADVFAKIDNDIALPGGWLERMISTLDAHPELDLLGMEAGMATGEFDREDGNGVQLCTHIGGVGLMRVAAFKTRPEIPYRGRFGFGEWQDRYRLVRGWVTPDIPCPQLDRLPIEPWASLTEEYIEKGWNRPWGKYSWQQMEHFKWIESKKLRA